MTHKTQKIIATLLIGFAVVAGFEALIYILNLNQAAIYLQVAFWIFLYLMFNIVFLFDLHVKNPGSWQRAKQKHGGVASYFYRQAKTFFSALWDRFEHLHRWSYIRQWLHFLLLPGFIFWASISLFYVNFNFIRIQQTIAVLSSTALILYYWYLKELFYRRKEIMDSDIFIALTVVKIYTIGLLYGAALSMLRYFCLPPLYFSAEVFGFTFLLLYQSLYQHRRINGYTLACAMLIAVMMAAIGQLVYLHWGYNYFTGAIFMAAAYNLFWGVFHYRLDHVLTRQSFFEIVLISVLIASMLFSVTNFRAKILDGCEYYGFISPTQTVTV